jgi:hypothetical protein
MISALSVFGLLFGAEAFKFSSLMNLPQIPGCSVDPSKFIGSSCEAQINLLNSTAHSQPRNLPVGLVQKFCSVCSQDNAALISALSQESAPSCNSAAQILGLNCQKNTAGDFCLSRISSKEFSSLKSEISAGIASNPNFALSDDQCKKLDCCFYQEFAQFHPKFVSLVDECSSPVPKTCESAEHADYLVPDKLGLKNIVLDGDCCLIGRCCSGVEYCCDSCAGTCRCSVHGKCH